MKLLGNKNIQKNYIHQYNEMLKYCDVIGDEILDKYNYIVFEGAQGLLLDRNNKSFFPNLTPSNTGMDNVLLMLYQLGASWDIFNDVEVCYVTRSYFTRHGAGAFHTECDKNNLAENMVDSTKQYNEFQGDFRYGYFDNKLFDETIKKDVDKIKERKIKVSLAITHLDETNSVIADGTKKGMTIDELKSDTGIFNTVYRGYGMTRDDVKTE